jgi:hypothetical protein
MRGLDRDAALVRLVPFADGGVAGVVTSADVVGTQPVVLVHWLCPPGHRMPDVPAIAEAAVIRHHRSARTTNYRLGGIASLAA